jgi:hypothetical protein
MASRRALGRASVRVGFAGSDALKNTVKANAIKAAVAAFGRISNVEARRHQSNFYPIWNVIRGTVFRQVLCTDLLTLEVINSP